MAGSKIPYSRMTTGGKRDDNESRETPEERKHWAWKERDSKKKATDNNGEED